MSVVWPTKKSRRLSWCRMFAAKEEVGGDKDACRGRGQSGLGVTAWALSGPCTCLKHRDDYMGAENMAAMLRTIILIRLRRGPSCVDPP
jgi:hypothetical protein